MSLIDSSMALGETAESAAAPGSTAADHPSRRRRSRRRRRRATWGPLPLHAHVARGPPPGRPSPPNTSHPCLRLWGGTARGSERGCNGIIYSTPLPFCLKRAACLPISFNGLCLVLDRRVALSLLTGLNLSRDASLSSDWKSSETYTHRPPSTPPKPQRLGSGQAYGRT